MAKLILLRHGESEWNEKGLWQGWIDIPLSGKGMADARRMGSFLKGIAIDEVYTSKLMRAIDTAKIILEELHLNPPITENEALNERDYGIYDAKNKWQIEEEVGEEKFQRIRRGWDTEVPGGENLKDVYERVVPYFENEIYPKIKEGRNILISAHGNSLRALRKYLDNLSIEDVENLEIGIGEVYVYTYDDNGKVIKRETLGEDINKGKH